MEKYGMTPVIDRLAHDGYCYDFLDNRYICFNSKKYDSTIIRIHQVQYSKLDWPYYMQISFPINTGGDLYTWPAIISTLNDHGIWSEIPTKGVFDEAIHGHKN